MNNCTFTGNLARDVESKNINGTDLAEFSIGVNTGWGDRKKVMWVKVKVWGKQAPSCAQYLSKGKKAGVSGRLSIEEWTSKDGKDGFSIVLDAHDVDFLSPRDEQDSRRTQDYQPQETPDLNDIPF